MHFYVSDEGKWYENKNLEFTSGSCIESLIELLDGWSRPFKNYSAVESHVRGHAVTAFYSKSEVKTLIDELTKIYDELEETDQHPKDCEDILDECEEFLERDEDE